MGDIARERVSWLSLTSGRLLANLGDQANMHETGHTVGPADLVVRAAVGNHQRLLRTTIVDIITS